MKHAHITAAQTAPWYETPVAAAALAAFEIDELFLSRPLVVMGDDCLHFTGDGIEALGEIRSDYVADLFGATWREACDAGRANEYLDLEATVPSVDAAMAASFGDPRRFGNEDPWKATQRMRYELRQRAERIEKAA